MIATRVIPVLVGCLLLACCWTNCQASGRAGLDVLIDRDGRYDIQIDGQQWLRSAPTFMFAHGQRYSLADGSLRLVDMTLETGVDVLGEWDVTALFLRPGNLNITLKAVFKLYRHQPILQFAQHFMDKVKGSSTGNKNDVASGFPSFYVEELPSNPLGYLAYGGIMFGNTGEKLGRWNVNGSFASGLDSGPLVLFAENSPKTIVISAFSDFMATSVSYTRESGKRVASWGIMGNVDTISKGFEPFFILYYSNQGVNAAIDGWGGVLRKYYNRQSYYRDSDFTNNYLGFWTDNGAYYYYNTEPKKNYEQTILEVKAYAKREGIPYRYVQYDSWFYFKGPANGVTEWTSMPSIFPNGLNSIWNQTGWPVSAHNRWWSYKTVYAKQNGGKYKFIVENSTKKSIPVDQAFWDDLMMNSKKWGLLTYEQDWLNFEFDDMKSTVSSLSLGRTWLRQMGKAAQKNGITIQYCMSPSRHALQSVEIPVVTQARVSNDYIPGNNQWKIGLSSIFAHALDIAPFKDNFWTTTTQPGNTYNASEPYPALQSLVATLSTGPVGPSDKVGYSDVDLIMKSCNQDGLLLKPSRPATALDAQIKMAAFKGFTGEVWSTYSDISGWRFGIVLCVDTNNFLLRITPNDTGFGQQYQKSVVFSYRRTDDLQPFSQNNPLMFAGCSKDKFCLRYTAPVFQLNGEKVIILGELNKWVPMSPNRVRSITVASDDIILILTGSVGEHVTITVAYGKRIMKIECWLSDSGTAKISIGSSQCFSV